MNIYSNIICYRNARFKQSCIQCENNYIPSWLLQKEKTLVQTADEDHYKIDWKPDVSSEMMIPVEGTKPYHI